MGNDEETQQRPLSDPDPRVQFQLGSMLRQVYGTVITEPVPDRFSALLNQLASAPQTDADRAPQSAADAAPAPAEKTAATQRASDGERT